MEPGRLDRRITLLQRNAVADDWNQSSASYHSLAIVWAQVQDLGAKEREEADQRVTNRSRIFTIRHRSDITTLHRISYDGDTYEITGLTEIGRKEGLRITAVARDND